MVGARLLHYEITEKLGEGGMGVVYKARDTHVDRYVALKVLPPERVTDPARRRRFLQEAKAASSLNHPNIITVHDTASDGGLDFIVMEFLAGKTLHELIGRKRLKLDVALKYAVQIAEALAAAHAAGIVHRDLKPGNVMVTASGLVKVIDFGLAKLAEPAIGEAASTRTMGAQTEQGVIVGTFAYMSPEQAHGKPVDPRSDIFSFGSLLYEMITGRRAFPGETALATLSAIAEKEPEPVSAIAEDTPPEVEKLIARCMRKEPERRIQHMGDVKLALEELREESESGRLRLSAPPRSRIPQWAVPALVFVATAVAGAIWWQSRAPQSAPVPVLTRLTSDAGLTTDPGLSPDGKLLAYASDRSGEGNLDIYVKQVGGGEPLRLTFGPGDKRTPTFSPDGTQIAYRSEQDGGGIYVVSPLGGPPRRIVPQGLRPQFSPDGNWIAYWVDAGFFGTPDGSKIYIVPSRGGETHQLRPDFAAAQDPVWAPDGEHLLFLGNRNEKLSLEGEEGVDWWVTPLDSGSAIQTGAIEVTRKANLSGPVQVYRWMLPAPVWLPQGDGLVFSARFGDSTNLWRIAISPKTFKATGPSQRLTSGATVEQAPSFATAPGGNLRVAFASVSENSDIWSLPIESNRGKVTGSGKRLTQNTTADFHPDVSTDGNKMVWISARSGSQEIWIRDLRTGVDFALTANRTDKWEPRLSPDGSRVSFSSYENTNRSWPIYVIPVAGGAPEKICEDCGEANAWSPDGKRIIGNRLEGQSWILDVASRRKSELLATRQWVAPVAVTPNNRWFTIEASNRVYVALLQDKSPIAERDWIHVIDRFWDGRWSPDGQLYYGLSDRDRFTCIWAQRVDPATQRPVGAPFAIFHSHDSRVSLSNQDVTLSIGRDKMLFNMTERTGNIWMAEWTER